MICAFGFQPSHLLSKAVVSPEARFQMLFLFPCRGGTLINVVAHHVDDRDQDKHGEKSKYSFDAH
jgi:hypothetical protein